VLLCPACLCEQVVSSYAARVDTLNATLVLPGDSVVIHGSVLPFDAALSSANQPVDVVLRSEGALVVVRGAVSDSTGRFNVSYTLPAAARG
jgi:hypothetical protein